MSGIVKLLWDGGKNRHGILQEKDIGGYYFPDLKEIAIFAQNIKAPIVLENLLFHEGFHAWLDHVDGRNAIQEMLNALYQKGESVNPELYKDLEKSTVYKKEERPEEFAAVMTDMAMTLGELERVLFTHLS